MALTGFLLFMAGGSMLDSDLWQIPALMVITGLILLKKAAGKEDSWTE